MNRIIANIISWALVLSLFAITARADERPIETISNLERNARLALFEARQHFDKEQFFEAVEVLRKYVRENKDKDHFLMQYHLANALLRIGGREESLEHYMRATEMEPRYAPAWLELGETAYDLQRFDIAAMALKNAYERSEEKRSQLLYYSAAAHVMGDNPDAAIPLLQELVSGKHGEPKLEWYRALIAAAVESKRNDDGQKAVDGLLTDFATEPDAWYLAFQFAAGIADYHQAAVALTITGYLRPLSRSEQMQLGDLYAAIEAPGAATAYYASAIGDSASAREMERLASAYISAYNKDRALETLTAAVKREPTSRLWSLMGDLHFMEERFEESLTAFANAARLDPENGRHHMMIAYCNYELGNNEAAIESCRRAMTFDAYADRAQNLLARLEK